MEQLEICPGMWDRFCPAKPSIVAGFTFHGVLAQEYDGVPGAIFLMCLVEIILINQNWRQGRRRAAELLSCQIVIGGGAVRHGNVAGPGHIRGYLPFLLETGRPRPRHASSRSSRHFCALAALAVNVAPYFAKECIKGRTSRRISQGAAWKERKDFCASERRPQLCGAMAGKANNTA